MQEVKKAVVTRELMRREEKQKVDVTRELMRREEKKMKKLGQIRFTRKLR